MSSGVEGDRGGRYIGINWEGREGHRRFRTKQRHKAATITFKSCRPTATTGSPNGRKPNFS